MDFPYTESQTNGFITDIFRFYAPKILTFNSANMDIVWVEHPLHGVMGATENPDHIYIYPLSIWNKSKETVPKCDKYDELDKYWFKYNCFVTVIHELYHVDQFCMYSNEYFRNPEYVNSIEFPVELNTAYYMSIHKKEILDNFGFQDNISIDEYQYAMRESGYLQKFYPYIRRTMITHLYSMLDELTPFEKKIALKSLVDKFNSFKTINITIEYPCHDNIDYCELREITVKSNYEWQSVNAINDKFTKAAFQYNYRRPIDMEYNINPISNRLELCYFIYCKHMVTLNPNF